jgi:hypothetical protein
MCRIAHGKQASTKCTHVGGSVEVWDGRTEGGKEGRKSRLQPSAHVLRINT